MRNVRDHPIPSSKLLPSVQLEFDVANARNRALSSTGISTMDYSSSSAIERSKIASNLYFDEKVPMYRIPTKIVNRQGSPIEGNDRSRNTWSIYSQQSSPTTATRRKREVTSSSENRATWTEVDFRQGSPTEIRYHTHRNQYSSEVLIQYL